MNVSGCIKGRSLWTVGLGVILGVCLIPVLTSVTGNTDDVNTHAQGQDTVDQGIRLAVICSKSDLPEDQRSNRDIVFEIRYCLGSSGFCQSEDNVIATLSRFYNATILENTPYQRGWMEKETFPDNITLHLIAKQESVSHCLKCHRTVDVTFKPQDLAVSTLCFKDLATLSGCLSSGPFSICGPSISVFSQLTRIMSSINNLPTVLLHRLPNSVTCYEESYGLASLIVLVSNVILQICLSGVVIFMLAKIMNFIQKYLTPLDVATSNDEREGMYGDEDLRNAVHLRRTRQY